MIKQITLKNNNKYVLSFDSHVLVVNKKDRLALDILDKEELSSYLITNDKEENILFNNLTEIDIKITNVGLMSFFFLKEVINKDAFMEKVSTLKDLVISDKDSKVKKLNKLCSIVEEFQPVLALYQNDQSNEILPSDINTTKFSILFVEREVKKIDPNKKQTAVGKYFTKLGGEKLSLIFAFISALILMFASCIGTYNCYPNNAIYIFFFICSLAGAVLSTFIYRDIYKKLGYKNSVFVTTVVLSLLGVGASAGIFYAYYGALKNIPEVVPPAGNIIIIGLIISVLLILISIFIPILLKKVIKKK